jgi:hypothetical protein
MAPAPKTETADKLPAKPPAAKTPEKPAKVPAEKTPDEPMAPAPKKKMADKLPAKPPAAKTPGKPAKVPAEKAAAKSPAEKEEAAPTPKPAPKPAGKPAPKKPDRRKQAATDLADVDQDFRFQGEYFGAVPPRVSDAPNMGLQVIARGDGKFDAELFRGGLPGAGWDRRTTVELTGHREEQEVHLTSDIISARVTGGHAVLLENHGVELVRLPKMHRISSTQDQAPPPGAIVLFDGASADQFEGASLSEQGLLQVGGLTKMEVRDFRLHLEFRTPYMPYAQGQGRGNSGVYIQQRYEVQILDSFGLKGVHNECGGLYKQKPPAVNMCLPPLSWQTYDITFTAARWDAEGNKVANARITVMHNGETIHDSYELAGKTGAGKPEEPTPRPILLQDHGNPVHFRNIWLLPLQPSAWVPCLPVAIDACGGPALIPAGDCWNVCP